MSLYFRKATLKRACHHLEAQLTTFRPFTGLVQYPEDATDKYKYCIKLSGSIKNAIALLDLSRNEVLEVLRVIEREYADTKKSDKKEFLEEFQAIESELSYDVTLEGADAMLSALKTRYVEVQHELTALSPMLSSSSAPQQPQQTGHTLDPDPASLSEVLGNGKYGGHIGTEESLRHANIADFKDVPSTLQSLQKYLHNNETAANAADQTATIGNMKVTANTDALKNHSLKPPNFTIPKFDGKTDFIEYWAIFETMVHENQSLSDTEKLLLLKESLTGQAAVTIKGIKVVPQNYQWMVNTIKKKYGNVCNVRARIIQRLSELRPAESNISSCETVYDEIRSLIHEMVSSGYNIIEMHDPMWIENILKKLPRNIVEEYLKENKNDACTVGQTLDLLEEVIARSKYIWQRLGNKSYEQKEERRTNLPSKPKSCVFCGKTNHKTFQCQLVVDVSARRKIVMENNLCWKCFSSGHKRNECSRSNCPRCGKLHDSSLCVQTATLMQQSTPIQRRTKMAHSNAHTGVAVQDSPSETPQFMQPAVEQKSIPSEFTKPVTAAAATPNAILSNSNACNAIGVGKDISQDNEQIVLMTAEGLVWNYKSEVYEKALFFFDTGAQTSLIDEYSAERLALRVLQSEQCSLSGIGGITETFISHRVVLDVRSAHGRDLRFSLRTKPTLVKGFPAVSLVDKDVKFMEQNNIYLSNCRVRGEIQTPQILIGIDLYSSFVLEDTAPLPMPSGLRVAKTIFGLAAYGRGEMNEQAYSGPCDLSCNTVVSNSTTESEMIKTMFELESLGITTTEGVDEECTYAYRAKYAQSIRFEKECVTAPFPLKENITELSNNRNLAFKRLIAQVRHLNSFPEQKKWYARIIKQYLQDDVIEEVHEPVPDSVGTYYMPHSGVWRENKATPLRIVFDASSHQRGKLSLNDVLFTGASFVNKIHDILVASREPPIILIADIQAAFTQIRIQESHRDLCRFLWIHDPEKPPIASNLVEYRWKRVPFGTTASPSILNMVISAYLRNVDSPLANEIQRYLYVDNILMTAYTEMEAIQKYRESKKMFHEIGMNLRSYISNCSQVNSQIYEDDRATCGPMKLLGVNYDPSSDKFSFTTDTSNDVRVKRDTLRQHHSIYDPIGFGAPLLIKQKCLLRSILGTAKEWNSSLDPQVIEEWNSISKDIDHTFIEIPRALSKNSWHNEKERNQLWIFADASSTAMAVCAFMEHNAESISNLLSGKTKLAPKKRTLSIPRLELLALLLALRLAESITNALPVGARWINIVSDSLIALNWIRTARKLPLFVVNQKDRIKTIIHRLTALGYEVNLFHVPSESNPADTGTRGVTNSQLPLTDWVNGPQWLLTGKHILTNLNSMEVTSLDTVEEEEIICAPEMSLKSDTEKPFDQIIDLRRHNSFSKALRVTALVGKFLRRVVDRVNISADQPIKPSVVHKFDPDSQITAEDMNIAEKIIFQLEHSQLDLNELKSRHRDKNIVRDQDQIIRCSSRLNNANLPYDTKNPIYIAPKSEVMRLVLFDLHRNNAHCGRNHLLALARQRFWLSRPSKVLRQILKHCSVCRRAQSLPFRTPEMAPLPIDRVRRTRPFENTGCDLIGPYTLQDSSKAYICLYTCLTTRAIHLEIVENLSASSFLDSFVRFIARRGVPKLVRTDCGTNFKLGNKVIDSLFTKDSTTDKSLHSYCAQQRITWVFNPPGAPWMGGVWERLVASVKLALQKSVGRRKLTIAEMHTVVTRIEAILNTRPLTAVSTSDVCAMPLRPVDFLQGNISFSLPSVDETIDSDDDAYYDPDCLQTVRQAKEALAFSDRIADKFWDVWNVEYLTILRDTHKIRFRDRRVNARPIPDEGEIVLIEHDTIPRGRWAIGRITELVPSADGMIRSAKVKLPYKNVPIQRPLSKLYPMEIRATDQESHSPQSKSPSASPSAHFPRQSPQRKAKTKARNDILRQLRANSDEDESVETQRRTMNLRGSHINILPYILSILLLAQRSVSAKSYQKSISCSNGIVTVEPMSSPFELCLGRMCREFSYTNEVKQYKIPALPILQRFQVVLRSNTSIESRSCQSTPFCEYSSGFLSKRLIANPHCWPTGAIISVSVIAYLLGLTVLLISWIAFGTKWKSRQRSAPDTTSIELHIRQPNHSRTQFSLNTFTPAMVSPVTLGVVIMMLNPFLGVSSCQDGYTRQSIELICTDRSVCKYQYQNELLFNSVLSSQCIQLRHANASVGYIKILRRPTTLRCSKVSLFWARDTQHRVEYVVRCRGMGSCVGTACESIAPDDTISELNHSMGYPGNSACSIQCSGFNCLCAIPIRACTFYRVIHLPMSPDVYEIFGCPEWNPTVNLDVSIKIYNTQQNGLLSLMPYTKHSFGDFDFTVISLQKPWVPYRTFAQAAIETLVLPQDFVFAAKCSEQHQARSNFRTCENTHFCACDISGIRPTCRCPYSELAHLRNNSDYLLPISTPYLSVHSENGTVTAASTEGEITILVTSMRQLESAHLNIDEHCTITAGQLMGCYSCLQGSQLSISCLTSTLSWATIQCAHHVFSIQCSPHNATTTLRLAFDSAIIESECFTICGGNNVSIQLTGVLYYHPHTWTFDVFLNSTHQTVPQLDWFHDINIPDLSPLWHVAISHWKLTLAVAGIVSSLLIITYVFGPAVAIYLLRTVCVVTLYVFRVMLNVLRLAIGMVVTCVRTARALRLSSQQ